MKKSQHIMVTATVSPFSNGDALINLSLNQLAKRTGIVSARRARRKKRGVIRLNTSRKTLYQVQIQARILILTLTLILTLRTVLRTVMPQNGLL